MQNPMSKLRSFSHPPQGGDIGAGAGEYDSTTEFVVAGWAKIRAAQHAVERQKEGRAIDFGGVSGGRENLAGPSGGRMGGLSTSPIPGEFDNVHDEGGGVPGMGYDEAADGMYQKGGDATSATLGGRTGLGLEGLSLDTVPNLNVTKMLGQIAKGLHEQPVGEWC